jgi:hypothetical protein
MKEAEVYELQLAMVQAKQRCETLEAEASKLDQWKDRASVRIADLERQTAEGCEQVRLELERRHQDHVLALDDAKVQMEELHAQQVNVLRKQLRAQAVQLSEALEQLADFEVGLSAKTGRVFSPSKTPRAAESARTEMARHARRLEEELECRNRVIEDLEAMISQLCEGNTATETVLAAAAGVGASAKTGGAAKTPRGDARAARNVARMLVGSKLSIAEAQRKIATYDRREKELRRLLGDEQARTRKLEAIVQQRRLQGLSPSKERDASPSKSPPVQRVSAGSPLRPALSMSPVAVVAPVNPAARRDLSAALMSTMEAVPKGFGHDGGPSIAELEALVEQHKLAALTAESELSKLRASLAKVFSRPSCTCP